jgi:hypothetical protein
VVRYPIGSGSTATLRNMLPKGQPQSGEQDGQDDNEPYDDANN